MLREHLSQDHDRASRRLPIIDRHVRWLHERVLGATPGRVLDLGCGPGLYTSALARRGHACVGIDSAPAAIAHARAEARHEGLACEYRQQDVRRGGFGGGFQLAMMVFGELNTFDPPDATHIVAEGAGALAPGGCLVLEVHAEAYVRGLAACEPRQFASERGLFSDRPHTCRVETRWDEASRTATERFSVTDDATGEVEIFEVVTRAYTDAEYDELFGAAGLESIERFAVFGDADPDPGFRVLVARQPVPFF